MGFSSSTESLHCGSAPICYSYRMSGLQVIGGIAAAISIPDTAIRSTMALEKTLIRSCQRPLPVILDAMIPVRGII